MATASTLPSTLPWRDLAWCDCVMKHFDLEGVCGALTAAGGSVLSRGRTVSAGLTDKLLVNSRHPLHIHHTHPPTLCYGNLTEIF